MTAITVDRLSRLFKYDPDEGVLLKMESRRNGFVPGMKVGHAHPNGYVYVCIDRRNVPVHRAAWALYYGAWPESDLDHIDQNKANNRIANLRLATPSQNQANTIRVNTLRRRGVRLMKGRYQANIKVRKKQINLGTHDTIDEAAHAYNKAAIKYFGDFAVLNPIGEDKPETLAASHNTGGK